MSVHGNCVCECACVVCAYVSVHGVCVYFVVCVSLCGICL